MYPQRMLTAPHTSYLVKRIAKGIVINMTGYGSARRKLDSRSDPFQQTF
jgi:hypothetical protein